MTDEMIIALARKDGVIQINFSCSFLNPEVAKDVALMAKLRAEMKDKSAEERREALKKLREQAGPQPRATIDDVVAHILHVIQIAGVDHVGIGSDFDGIPCAPEGLEDVSKFPNLTRKLLEAGLSAADIGKIYGGNLLRVMRAVEKVSAAAKPPTQYP